jgi:hypothetical protein
MISPKTSAEAGPSAQMIFLQISHRSDGGAAGELCDRSAYARPFNQHSAALALSREGLFGASGPLRSNISALVARLLPNAEKTYL